MIVDEKQTIESESDSPSSALSPPPFSQKDPLSNPASSSSFNPTPIPAACPAKLTVSLCTPRQIYTAGSTVSGVIRLSAGGGSIVGKEEDREKEKDRALIEDVNVSLICVVRSVHHRYYGGSWRDVRRETTTLVHRDQTLWARSSVGDAPPNELPFEMVIPDVGNDVRAQNADTPLPPSFHGGKHHGWRRMFTYGTPIGFVKYYIKAGVVRKGAFKRKERAFAPFIFLPPSDPPPLLPTPPPSLSPDSLTTHLSSSSSLWAADSASTTLRQGLSIRTAGLADLTLWLPHVPAFPRSTRIPFVLCLAVHGADVDVEAEKATLFLRRRLRSCARGGMQHHTTTYERSATDNMLHGITPLLDEGEDKGGEGEKARHYVWRGLWVFRETPDFENRQLAWKYKLVANVPIKGLRNSAQLVSRELAVCSGVVAGANPTKQQGADEEDSLELPPDYFEPEAGEEDGDDESGEVEQEWVEKS